VLALIVDTSSAAVTAGIARVSATGDYEVLAERVTVNARGHAELLSPAIASCLAAADARPGDIGAVVAGVGPGPFTGLRVGLMTATAFADALGLPAYGVCSLDAIAADVDIAGRLLVAGDARRREIYWASYLDAVRETGPGVGKATDLEPGPVAAVAGAGARLYRDAFDAVLLEQDYPSVSGLIRCAAERIASRQQGESLMPLYLRRPDAVVPAVRTI
jgi:tRNA threonylcarbamoyl adenosine modification protein YeaZ